MSSHGNHTKSQDILSINDCSIKKDESQDNTTHAQSSTLYEKHKMYGHSSCRCMYCNQEECEWLKLGHYIRNLSRIMDDENNRCHCHLYRYFIELKYTKLDKYDGLWIPWCVEKHIMDMYPYPSNFRSYIRRVEEHSRPTESQESNSKTSITIDQMVDNVIRMADTDVGKAYLGLTDSNLIELGDPDVYIDYCMSLPKRN